MKKVLCFIVCLLMLGSLVGCGNKNAETEVVNEHTHEEDVSYVLIDGNTIGVVCPECRCLIGEFPLDTIEVPVEKIVEKEVFVDKIVEKPVEVIVEKPVEVVVEKEVNPLEACRVLTWSEVCQLKPGDSIENVFIKGNSFVSRFTNDVKPSSETPHRVQNAKDPQAEAMPLVELKVNYYSYGEYITTPLSTDYEVFGDIGILSGRIETLNWNSNILEITLVYDTVEVKTFLDFVKCETNDLRG